MVLEEIAGLIGSAYVLSQDELAGRPRDFWTKEPTQARALVRPGNVAEVSSVLALCNARGQKVIPEGGRTNLVQGTKAAGDEILRLVISVGGALSGEHGIGLEKIGYMAQLYTEADLAEMRRLRDVWNPHDLCNPGKVIPAPGRCIEPGAGRGRKLPLGH